MADASNPFADIYNSPESAAPPPDADVADNPFADIYKQPDEPSALGAAFHHAEAGALPAAGGLAAMGAGAEAGALIGAPLGPVGAAVGGIGGGLFGAFAGSSAVSAVQDWALSKLPESWQDMLGQSQKQRASEEEKQPTASFIGGLVPYALTMKPSFNAASKALPENATAIQRLMANPLTAHLFGGVVTGGMELGTETANRQQPNWTKIGIATAFGTIFNEPTKIGERLTEAGAQPVRGALGLPAPAARAPAAGVEQEAPVDVVPNAPAKPGGVILGTIPNEVPTVAQAGDAKVLGPGIDEAVFMGAHEQAPEALMTTQDAARTETSVLHPETTLPSVSIVARRMQPDLFNHYDDLQAQRDDLTAHWSSLSEAAGGAETPEMQEISKQIIATDLQLRTAAPEVGAAYRRAADVVQSPTVEPEAAQPENAPSAAAEAPSNAENAPTSLTTAAGRPLTKADLDAEQTAIAQQVTANLLAAGRPQAEAEAGGQLLGHYYRTRSSKFKGALGSPLELFNQQAPIIRGYGASGAPLMPTEARPTIVPEKAPTTVPENVPAEIAQTAQAPATHEIAHETPRNTGAPASEIEALDPANIGVDASRFQFKAGGDEAGDTERLQGVEKWDPRLAGTALVFRDADGRNWIADGHQRIGLANRLMANGHPPIKINAFVLDAADGMTDADARAIAAVKNIAEGTGSAVDAAKVIREAKASGIDLPPLPPRSALVRDGNALAELSPEAFDVVVNDVVPVQQGAIVGRMVRDPAQQVEALRLLAAMKPENVTQAEMVVRDMLSSGTQMTRQGSLFGEEAFASSIVRERAKVADEALKQLRRDKQTFKTLVDEAERIQGAGANVLDQTANQGRLSTDEQAADFLKQLAFRAGPVSDALSEVARQLKAGTLKPAEAARSFLESVRRAVEGGVVEGAGTGRPELGAAGERQELATEPGAEGLPQTLLPGVEPITQAQRIASEADRPLTGGEAEPGGLFDEEARNQQELFQTRRGALQLRPGQRNILKLLEDANASTFIHESGHQWLEDLMKDAVHPAAPDALKDDAQTVRDWLGIKDIGDPIKTAQHEKFARGFEQYVREGVAPSPGLARVFAQFKTWLTQIYQSIKGLGAPINEDIRSVFDRMLAEEPNRTVISPDDLAREPSLPSLHEAEAADAAPHEAHAIGDRIVAETGDYLARQPIEVQNEIAAVIARQQAEALAGTEPAGEAGAGAGGPNAVVPGGLSAGPEPAGGAGGGEHGPELGGGGNGVSGGAGLAAAGEPSATGLRDDGSEPAGNARAAATRGNPLAPTPATTFPEPESAYIDRAGNIKRATLGSTDDVWKAVKASADRNEGFIGDRRGRVTDGQLLALSHQIGMDGAEKIVEQWVRGRALNGSEIVALGHLAEQTAMDVHAASVKAAASIDPADLLAQAEAEARHDLVQAALSGSIAESGRATRAIGLIKQMNGRMPAAQIARQAVGKTLFQIAEEAKAQAALDDPAQLSKFRREQSKISIGRGLFQLLVNNLISNPITHVTYAAGNGVLLSEKLLLQTPTAAFLGSFRSPGQARVRFGEVPAGLAAAWRSLPGAVQGIGQALRSGQTPALPGEESHNFMFPAGPQGARPAANLNATWHDVMSNAYGIARGVPNAFTAYAGLLKGGGIEDAPTLGRKFIGSIPDIQYKGVTVLPLGTALSFPSRQTAAIHTFFRVLNYAVDISQQAYRTAANEGLKDDELSARIGQLTQSPTREMMDSAGVKANDLTLMGKSGDFMSKVSQLLNWEVDLPVLGNTQPLRFLDPFTKIAGQMAKQGVQTQTPVALLSLMNGEKSELGRDISGRNGGAAQDMAVAKILVGTSLAVGFGMLKAGLNLTGSGPSDPREKALWRMQGNQPYSIKIGDTWYSYHRLGPLGFLAGLAADMYDAGATATTGDMHKAAAQFLFSFSQNFLDEGFMSGPAEMFKAVDNPDRDGQRFVTNFLGGFVPYSQALAQATRMMDPYQRQSRTFMDNLKAKLPWTSQELPPRRDIWGQPIPNARAFGPTSIYMTQMNNDPVLKAMDALSIFPGPAPRAIRGVQLNDQQYDQFQVLSGGMAKQQLDKIVRSPQFMQWPPETRHDVIVATMNAARETARNMIMARNPSIAVQAVQNKLAPLKKVAAGQ